MSIELCFLINLLADFSLLSATARGLGRLRLARVGPAALLAALYGTLAGIMPALARLPVQLMLLIPLCLLVSRRASPLEPLTLALSLVVTVIMTGTCARYCRHPWAAIAVTPMLCGGTTRLRRASLSTLPTRVEIVNRGKKSTFDACIDTGNRLTEPLSGQPVLIANERLVRTVLPDRGYREVAYGSVGGAGTLRCFRPDHVYVDVSGRRRLAPDTWVAVFPSRLPGGSQALAPAEYVLL